MNRFYKLINLFLCIGLILGTPRNGEALDPQGIMGEERSSDAGQAADASETTEAQIKERLKTVVSLSFSNADLRNVLGGLAKTYNLNIVVDDKVKGTVNVNLKGVTLGDAIKQILKLNGYTAVWEGSIMRVVSLEEEVVTTLLYLNFIQPDVAMEFLKGKASEGGVMKIDESQNGIFITDKASRIEDMQKVLKQIDLPPQQVLIQARLLDITHTDLENFGVKFSSTAYNIHLSSSAKKPLAISAGSIDLSGPSSDLTSHAIVATFTNGANTTTATIDALLQNKKVKVLASPTIMTLNNVESKITIGEKFPIKETTQTTTGTLQTTRFIDVGITMRVTPKINRQGYVQLQIHPEVSSVSSTLDAGPRITTREADTTLIVKDRESVIIAGLIKEEETQIKGRIPFISSIPLIGLLFSNRSKTYEQKELVIVITPYLVPVNPPQVAPDSEAELLRQRIEATEIFNRAQDFENGRSLLARKTPETLRIREAINLYNIMVKDFPEHLFAPEALWRAADLQWGYMHDSFSAEELLTRLVTRYPTSAYSQAGRRRLRELQAYQIRQKRKNNEERKEAKARPQTSTQTNFSPLGFR